MKKTILLLAGIALSTCGPCCATEPSFTTLNLGTKTLRNFLLVGKHHVEFSCVSASDFSPQSVKFGNNSSVTNFMPKASGDYDLTPEESTLRNKRFTFQPNSSATQVKCGIRSR